MGQHVTKMGQARIEGAIYMQDYLRKIANRLAEKSEQASVNFLAFMSEVESQCDDDDDVLGDDVVATTLESDLQDIQKQKLSDLEEEVKKHYKLPDAVMAVAVLGENDINVQGNFGFTKLHEAVMDNDLVAVMDLVSKGADRTIKDKSGHTPLDKAGRLGNADIINLLSS